MTRKENVANGKRRPLGLESPERPCLFRFTVVKPEHLNSLVLSGLEFMKVRVAHSNRSQFLRGGKQGRTGECPGDLRGAARITNTQYPIPNSK
jgi:hypothetical protein